MSTGSSRTAALLLACAITLGGCADSSGTSSSEACEAPNISVSPTTVAVGDAVEVVGSGFTGRCDDAPGVSAGVQESQPEQDGGYRDLTVQWVQEATLVDLAPVDADTDGSFSVTVVVPPVAEIGDAAIRVSGALLDAALTVQ